MAETVREVVRRVRDYKCFHKLKQPGLKTNSLSHSFGYEAFQEVQSCNENKEEPRFDNEMIEQKVADIGGPAIAKEFLSTGSRKQLLNRDENEQRRQTCYPLPVHNCPRCN